MGIEQDFERFKHQQSKRPILDVDFFGRVVLGSIPRQRIASVARGLLISNMSGVAQLVERLCESGGWRFNPFPWTQGEFNPILLSFLLLPTHAVVRYARVLVPKSHRFVAYTIRGNPRRFS